MGVKWASVAGVHTTATGSAKEEYEHEGAGHGSLTTHTTVWFIFLV